MTTSSNNNQLNTVTIPINSGINIQTGQGVNTNNINSTIYSYPTTTASPIYISNITSSNLLYKPLYLGSANDKILSIKVGDDIIFEISDDFVITWNDNIKLDDAAEQIKRLFIFSSEKAIGITNNTKRNIRNDIFKELIEIAEEKKSLSSEDLKFILRSMQIMEKLKD